MINSLTERFSSFTRRTNLSPGMNLASVIFSIFSTGYSIWLTVRSSDGSNFVTNISLAVICVILIGWIFFREFWLARKQKYANITSHFSNISLKTNALMLDLNDDIVDITSTSRFKPKVTDKYFADKISDILDDFSVMFDLLTATKCRSSIKTISGITEDGSGREFVVCFARDRNSGASNHDSDIRRAAERIDTISQNSDFQNLLFDGGPRADCYINNNIVKSLSKGNFKSTSLEWYKRERYKVDTDGQGGKFLLPYKSTMVWPIRTFELSPGGRETPRFIGFLCVDSEYSGVFNYRWDKSLGLTLAHQLVSVFHLKQQLDILNEIETGVRKK